MRVRIFQVDAFTDKLFHGNPAAVCPLDEWLPAETMQKIAMENNLAETAFFVKAGDRWAIRWFTPAVEVDLCGHATLASAFVLFHFLGHEGPVVELDSASGPLSVRKNGESLTLDFPADRIEPVSTPESLVKAIGVRPREAYRGKSDLMLVFSTQKEIEEMSPDPGLLALVPARGIIVTARGDEVDFVSRFFAPRVGVPEDPVTGSAHTTLTPFWSKRLEKTELSAMQLSKRRGWLRCRPAGDRVEISGRARAYLIGTIETE